MRTTRFAERIRRGWLAFKAGIRSFDPGDRTEHRYVESLRAAAINSTESERTLRDAEEPREIPVNCPSSPDLRTVAQWLSSHYPVAATLDLVKAKDYSAAHELVGVHDAIQSIRQLADDLDAAQADEEAQKASVE